jgi:hypothetical protein
MLAGSTLAAYQKWQYIRAMTEDVPDDASTDEPHSPRGPVVALVVIVLLVLGGLWLTQHIGANSRLQDCVSSGRSNCAPIKP